MSVSAVAQQADTVKNKFMPTGIRVGIDAVSLIKSSVNDDFSGYEINADIDFYRYYLALEMGHWERNLAGDNERYSNDGNYMRLGIDVNFLTKDTDKNMFFIGARYGWGKFSDQLSVDRVDAVWGTATDNFSNNDVTAGWIELTTGLRVKMYKILWMGYTARYKFGLNTNGDRTLIPADVPGYGRTDKDATWGFNYVVMIRIPIPKKK